MSAVYQNIFLSEKSVMFHDAIEADTKWAGQANPIRLPFLSIDRVLETIGQKIATGFFGSVFQVNGCSSSRVYKVISQSKFADGNEILISKIASDIDVAPSFYSAFLVEQEGENYLFIEMDDAGKSLGKWMEALAENEASLDEEKSVVAEEAPLTETEKAMQEILKKYEAEKGFAIKVKEVSVKKKLTREEAIIKLYTNPEIFYFELFNKIKILAESKISYKDTHVGNIMPHPDKKNGLKLIDFDKAKIMSSTEDAVLESLKSNYNQLHLEDFKKLPNLSSDSLELISWFKEKMGFWG